MIGSADEFKRLRESLDPVDYERAGREEASETVWLEVLARYPELKRWVAYNKTVPIPVLEILALDSDPEVRCAVAVKRKLSAPLFDALSKDEDENVRCAIGLNPRAPDEIVLRLSSDKSKWVREQITSKRYS